MSKHSTMVLITTMINNHCHIHDSDPKLCGAWKEASEQAGNKDIDALLLSILVKSK